ncbi:AraC family transcriptional regulator [Psychrobacillus psychrodurans]|uniref:helix-turn-helix transcriptional regulator n=1 Tax=Psychrobacillus TaxID=1221880 RepID=UPI001F4D3A2E|nr:AraC family transcriptional regulator [Psychrobacillus psychrodurans]MCK1996928.1 AraC family transcriptional regulator [Psychrobacillus psychrodurans]
MYSKMVMDVVNVLEEHLMDEWKLEDYAMKIGYSKFHSTRAFKKETGMTIGEYIRKRRLAMAAQFLLHSDLSIIQISVELHFQSQEAFTRSFKDSYKMPPGKYRTMMRTLQKTEDGQMAVSNEIKGWVLSGSNPEGYEMRTDSHVFHSGTKSGYLASRLPIAEGQFGTMMQSFSAKQWQGKRIKLSCFIKTEEVIKCGAWCRIDNHVGDMLQFDNMDNRAIHGTTDWNYYAIVLDVPEESASIHFGILLIGSGKVWTDSFKFEGVSLDIPSTNMLSAEEDLPLEPENLGFDEL